MEKKILLIIAHEGYQQVEYNDTKKTLRTLNMQVFTASNIRGSAIAKDGSTTLVDIAIKDVVVAHYDGIFFIGGPGTLENLDNEASYLLAKEAVALHKPLGAICIATRILAHARVLNGKNATGWNEDHVLNTLYPNHNITYDLSDDVIVDGIIVTAVGPESAQKFAQKIAELVK